MKTSMTGCIEPQILQEQAKQEVTSGLLLFIDIFVMSLVHSHDIKLEV